MSRTEPRKAPETKKATGKIPENQGFYAPKAPSSDGPAAKPTTTPSQPKQGDR